MFNKKLAVTATFAAVLFATSAAQNALAQTKTVTFAQATYAADEGDTVTIPVNLSENAAAEVTVSYTVGGSAESVDDFVALSGGVTIASGAAGADIRVDIWTDIFRDPDETITLTLTAPGGYTLGAISTATINITDTTEDIRIHFNPTSVTVNETDDPTRDPDTNEATSDVALIWLEALADHPDNAITLAVSLLRSSEGVIEGEFARGACTAKFTVTFTPGVNVISFPSRPGFDPVDDDLVEHDEMCVYVLDPDFAPPAETPWALDLAQPDDADGSWTMTVVDDDRDNAHIAFGDDAAATTTFIANAAEADGTFTIAVTINAPPQNATTFYFEDDGGTATEGVDGDYVLGDPVVFPAEARGEDQTQNFVITLRDDSDLENDEIIKLKIRAPDIPADDLGDYYARAGASAEITLTSEDLPHPLDANADGVVTARDGILIARFLLGAEDASLTAGVSGASPSPSDIVTHLTSAKTSGDLDADGNGDSDWRDGILFARYLFGLRDGALIGENVTIETADTVETTIAGKLPAP